MAKNYRQLIPEVHDMHVALEKAYDRGYEQARIDYERPPGQWMMVAGETGAQYKCLNCKSLSVSAANYCQWCGVKMVEEILKNEEDFL